MGFTISKCFSILVASGNGQRCALLREKLKKVWLETDNKSGKLKIRIHKFEKKSMPETYQAISLELQDNIDCLYGDIDDRYFLTAKKNKKDLKSNIFPRNINANNETHIWLFCLLLERLMVTGRWSGDVAQS